jgi:hypothetical protein
MNKRRRILLGVEIAPFTKTWLHQKSPEAKRESGSHHPIKDLFGDSAQKRPPMLSVSLIWHPVSKPCIGYHTDNWPCDVHCCQQG